MSTPLEERRFLFITGKGGVGKTTVTAALALALAAKGKRVLCCACAAKERFSMIFRTDPVGTELLPMAPNVWAVNMEPEVAMAEYGSMFLKSQTLYRAVFENRYVKSFFAATPGLYEWAMLGKAWFHTTEKRPDGSPKFDVVLLDAPATGHGLDMLRVPKVIVELVPPGILRRDADRAWAMFRDPKQTGVVVVTLPEEMPTSETLELTEALDKELGLDVARLVVNGMLPPLFTQDERDSLLAPRPLDEASGADQTLAAGVRRAYREQVQSASLKRLKENLSVATTHLPHLYEEAQTLPAVQKLMKRLL